jgi:hypothetical protein
MVGGALLFFRRTTMLGAAILIAVLSNVVMLNYAFDVPVKLYSTNLLLMAVFLLTPELRRLTDLFLLNRTVHPASLGATATSPRWKRGRLVLKPILVAAGIGLPLYQSYDGWKQYGEGAPKPALHGIWEVQQFVRNRDTIPALLGDSARWRRFLVNASYVSLQTMTDSIKRYRYQNDSAHARMTITSFNDSTKHRTFAYTRESPTQLRFDGLWGTDSLHVRMRRIDEKTFLLLSRGYHWINEFPFNR